MRRFASALVLGAGIALLAMPTPASAKPNRPGVTTTTASCSVTGASVAASGLPTNEVVNFMVTDSNGTSGWVLGFTSDGTWSVAVPTADEPTTYEFVSRTLGPNGSRYTVFASCS